MPTSRGCPFERRDSSPCTIAFNLFRLTAAKHCFTPLSAASSRSLSTSTATRSIGDVFEFDLLGVPQTRVRLIAGTPALLVRLRQLRSSERRRGVCSVIREPRGTHVRGTDGSKLILEE